MNFFQQLFAVLGLSLAFVPCASAVTIVHSNDILGEIEPCGCRTNPMGGVARVYNFLRRLPDQQIVLLDGGDLLFPSGDIPEALRAQSLIQATDLVKAMGMLHYDAIVPGEKDFSMGLATFSKITHAGKVKFIAANLLKRGGGEFLSGSLWLTRKDASGKSVKIAVIGLVDPGLDWPKELRGQKPIPIAKRWVASVRKKADWVIALTHEGLDKDKELAEAVPGIDVIIGGHSQSFLQAPLVVGGAHIYQSSFRNQYLGTLSLTKPLNDETYKLTGLDVGYDSPAQAPSAIDDLVTRFKTDVAIANEREEASLRKSNLEAQNTEKDSQTKFQTFPKCAECHLKQFDFWRKTPHARALDPLVEAKQDQNKECLQCHTVAFNDPKGWTLVTRLAEIQMEPGAPPAPSVSIDQIHAFLHAMNRADSLDTPVQELGGKESLPLRQSFGKISRMVVPVQCENCHQPGYDHPFSGTYTKTVARDACLKCHTPDRAPEWYTGPEGGRQPNWTLIEAKRASITCPAGDPVPAK